MATPSVPQKQQDTLLPALVSATRACSRRLDNRPLPEAAVYLVSSFLDFAHPPFWSIPRASARRIDDGGPTSDLRLLQRILVREPRDLDYYYRAHLFNQALLNAVENSRVDIVEWLCMRYLTIDSVPTGVMEKAAELGELEIM